MAAPSTNNAHAMVDVLQAGLDAASALRSDICSEAFAAALDRADTLARFRDEFLLPPTPSTAVYRSSSAGRPCVYLCGNSLGLQPKRTRSYINAELDHWALEGVEGHVRGERPWWVIESSVTPAAARVVGALEAEVAIMNSLTTNLHVLMTAFYKPAGGRTKILTEAHAFSSDQYAVKSQIALHGLMPEEHHIEVAPLPGEETISDERIIEAIRAASSSLACVLIGGVQYYTGQLFNIPAIVAAAHEVGAIAGVDLAHAVGNVPLQLHDWDVDFAAWCNYKYMNSGPGAIAGIFVHERFANESMTERPHFAGWWGHRRDDRFKMGPDFIPIAGAARFQLSNPPVFQVAALRASLDVFDEAGGMSALRAKSLALTGYLEALLRSELGDEVCVITPSAPECRGCQLSLVFSRPVQPVHAALLNEGIIVDKREPRVIRVAPVPLYNTAADVLEFVTTLKLILAGLTM